MKNKVLFVHDGPLNVYGKDKYGMDYNNALVERYTFFGNTVSFLMREKNIPGNQTKNFSKIDHPAFQFIPIPDFKSLKTLKKRGCAKKIIKQAVREHDMIIARLPSSAGKIAFREALRLKKPVLVEMVACVFDTLWYYDWRGKLLAPYKNRQYKKIVNQASHIIYVTQNFLQSRYPTAGKSIGCSDVILPEVGGEVLKERKQKIHHLKVPLKILSIGTLNVSYKGLEDGIKAIYELKKQGKPFQYEIIGYGDPAKLQALLQNYGLEKDVTLTGGVPHDQVFEKIQKTDVYLQPSKAEGLPRTVIEAMYMACPVIGTDAGGIPELLEEHCIYPKGNVEALKEKLLNLRKDLLLEQAQVNSNKSKQFSQEILDRKRVAFYKMFVEDWSLREPQ